MAASRIFANALNLLIESIIFTGVKGSIQWFYDMR